MTRRVVLLAMLNGSVALALAMAGANSAAQRPANPIARPPRPGGPIGPGRFPRWVDGVAAGQPPGLFVVRAVNDRDNVVQLSDADGRTGAVYVRPDVFDLSELKPGDEVLVDFFVPNDSSARLEAAGIWRK